MTAPSAPSNLYANGVSVSEATLYWTGSTPGSESILGYSAEKSSDDGVTWNTTGISIVGNTADIAGLSVDTIYLFRVRAETENTESAWSGSLTYDTAYWETSGQIIYGYPPPGYADISFGARLNELADTTGESPTTAANILAGTEGESLTTALNIAAGTEGESAATALNIIAGTTGEPAAEAARLIGTE